MARSNPAPVLLVVVCLVFCVWEPGVAAVTGGLSLDAKIKLSQLKNQMRSEDREKLFSRERRGRMPEAFSTGGGGDDEDDDDDVVDDDEDHVEESSRRARSRSCSRPPRPTTKCECPSGAQCGCLVIGIDGGTESIRAAVFDRSGKVLGMHSSAYSTRFPEPGYAEQDPEEWWVRLGEAVRGAVERVEEFLHDAGRGLAEPRVQDRVVGLSLDTTCCTVVALGRDGMPLRPALLWMDARSSKETKDILEMGRGDESLKVNCGGEGPISAEWMLPKSLWLKRNERKETWDASAVICEYQDYINLRLTGRLVASSCNAASRWHWDGEDAIRETDHLGEDATRTASPIGVPPSTGRPLSLLRRIDLEDLNDKWPDECISPGATVGGLTTEAAEHCGLREGTLVAQGGADAFIGMLGLGCIHPGQLALITGSSHLHLAVSSSPTTSPGMWGSYRGAPLPGMCFAEGGQSSTGSLLRWFKGMLGDDASYKELDDEAAKIPIGCDGLSVLETFQGSRTPATDPLARGAIVGLTLSHSRSHIWRGIMESVCYGTRRCIEALKDAGHGCNEILLAGGVSRSRLWLQMHADVTGLPVVVCECSEGPLLGCATLAAAAAGIHSHDITSAVENMVKTASRIEPDRAAHDSYTRVYKARYKKLAGSLAPFRPPQLPKETNAIIAASMLACDWSDMKGQATDAISGGAAWLHIDMFDGVEIDSPDAFTFGPPMVKFLRKHTEGTPLDVHLVAARPLRYVEPLASAGADHITVQWESLGGDATSRSSAFCDFAAMAREQGVRPGVCIAISTGVDEIEAIVAGQVTDLVNILCVETGFGGQAFQDQALEKVRWLKGGGAKGVVPRHISVDGGISAAGRDGGTARMASEAGANVLVSGSFVFGHPGGCVEGVKAMLEAVATPC